MLILVVPAGWELRLYCTPLYHMLAYQDQVTVDLDPKTVCLDHMISQGPRTAAFGQNRESRMLMVAKAAKEGQRL
jgi:hypothetical protein